MAFAGLPSSRWNMTRTVLFDGHVGEGADTAVVLEPVAVEDDLFDALRQAHLGDQSADLARRLAIDAGVRLGIGTGEDSTFDHAAPGEAPLHVEAHADERLYRLGSAVVDALSDGAPIERLARYFEYWILRLQGVYPALIVCPGCGGPLEGGAIMLGAALVYFVSLTLAGVKLRQFVRK